MSKQETHQPLRCACRPAPTVLTALASALILSACGGGSAPEPSQVVASTAQSAPAAPAAPAATAPVVPATPAAPGAQPGKTSTATSALATPSVATDTIFAPTSFWYQPIPATVALHANSANFKAEFLRQKAAYYGTVNINTWAYSSPVYTADASTPVKQVAFNNCQNKTYPEPALLAQWSAVPIPANAAPADGTDAEMTVYQPSTDTLWEFWVARNSNGQWAACWGGRMNNVSTSDGIFPFPYGTTATGLPFIGGQITAEELERGEIRHAIGISLVETEAATIFSWPAKRSDGVNPQNLPNRIPEGLRFRLDPAIDVDTLPMTTAGKIIAKAAQTYGFVVWDKAGAISLRVQNPKSYTTLGLTNPYTVLFAGKPSYAVLDGLPWDRLQFLPMNYGKP